MPVQTTKKNLLFPDGCKVEIDDGTGWFDVGAINSAVTATLEFSENQVDTANAGKSDKQIASMTISGGFELIHLDPEGVSKLGGGMFDLVQEAGGAQTPEDQALSSVAFSAPYGLELLDTGDNILRPTTLPTITSVTASVAGALAEDDDYIIVPDSSQPSGYSIVFVDGGAAGMGAGENVVVVYGSTTIRAGQTLYMGASSIVMSAAAMRYTHTDDNARVRSLTLYAVEASSGGFQFNFKGANEDGLESMPIAFTARLDTARTSKRQLAAWYVDDGAL